MFSNKLNYKLFNLTILMILIYILISNIKIIIDLIKNIILVTIPFIFSFSFAYILNPVINKLEKYNIKRKYIVFLLLIIISIIMTLIVVKTLPMIYEQLITFSKNIIFFIENIGQRFNLKIDNIELIISKQLNYLISNLSNFISKSIIYILNISINFFTKLVLFFITWIYFLLNMNKIRSCIKNILKRASLNLFQYLKKVDFELNNYIKGLSVFMIIQFIEYSILLLLIGHPNWLIIGILASIASIIPYIGGIITTFIAIVTVINSSTKIILGTIIIFIIFPIIDEYIISPKIYGKTNNINPVVTIIIVFIFNKLFGILGIIIAIPLYIVIQTTYFYLKKDINIYLNSLTR